MNLRCALILFAFALILPAANAQVGIYGKFEGVHVSSGSSTNFVTPGWYKGPAFGGYFDLLHFGPLALGGDVRSSYLFQNPQKYRDFLIGVRLAAKPPVLPIKPYIQVSAGFGGTSHSGLGNVGTSWTNKFQYQVLGGIDHQAAPLIDWRMVELGYGHMTGISSGPPVSGTNLFSIGTGVVVRLP